MTPSSAQNNMSSLTDMPLNTRGRVTRYNLLQELGKKVSKWNSEKRCFITIYSGARTGKGDDYMALARRLGATIEKEGWVVINGGTSKGQMGAVLEKCTRQICFIPSLFASQEEEAGIAVETLHSHAVNTIVPDFWERKVAMTLLGKDGFFVLPGGFGTLDEAFESIIFAGQRSTPLVFINPNGYWDRTLAQLQFFKAQGLLPAPYLDCVHVAKDENEAIRIVKDNQKASSLTFPGDKNLKPSISLRSYLEKNPHVLPNALNTFCGEAPRVGLLASGNIGKKSGGAFDLPEHTPYRDRLLSDAKEIARTFAKEGAVLLLMGSRKGLRGLVADAALAEGGRVIWLDATREGSGAPISITIQPNGREMTIGVPRYFERARLFATIAQGECVIAGGIHTANEMLSHLTRNQTGHGDYCDLLPHCRDKNRPRLVIYAYNPVLDFAGTTLWGLLKDQFYHGSREGFIGGKADLNLLSFENNPRKLVQGVLSGVTGQPDFIGEFAQKGRGHPPKGRHAPQPLSPSITIISPSSLGDLRHG